MDFLTRFGLHKARFTTFFMVLLIALGGMSYLGIPKREDPAITIRTGAVIANFEGMSPERIENLIADPIERKIREIGEVEDIDTIITSGQALFYVTLYDTVSAAQIEEPWEDLRNKMLEVVPETSEPSATALPCSNPAISSALLLAQAVCPSGAIVAKGRSGMTLSRSWRVTAPLPKAS